MPIYEFECTCGNTFEQIIMKDNEKVVCPKCNKTKVKKLMSAAGFKFGISFKRRDVQEASSSGNGIVTKTPIIKDRNTGNHLYP